LIFEKAIILSLEEPPQDKALRLKTEEDDRNLERELKRKKTDAELDQMEASTELTKTLILTMQSFAAAINQKK
jgi:hypothetical protein